MKLIITLALSFFVLLNCFSQNNTEGAAIIRLCGTPILNEEYEIWIDKAIQKQNQFANLKKTSTVYTIPVVFHIIHSGQAVGTSYNISLAQVNSQINILNQDFRKTNPDFATTVTQTSFVNSAADCEINFCAARISPSGTLMAEPGVDRISTVAKGWNAPPYKGMIEPGGYIDNTIKVNSSWDPTKYLNIWILPMNDGVLGYAQFPTVPAGTTPITDIVGWGGAANTDGVVFDYRYVGNVGAATYPFNKGRTATHEIGHWLGLRHINGDASCGNDYCTDTPAQGSLTSGCPSTTGGASVAGCTVTSNPPGKMYQNFMDYSDDRCMTMFTTAQKARMQACMANCARRTSLNTSTVCNVSSVIGINENVSEMNMEVFPNPSSGDLYVTVNMLNQQDYTITIINTLGQTVKEIKQVQSNGSTLKIDLSDKSPGIYFVTVKSKSVSKTKRIVLQ
ncbi:MAG: M43 family zinc metalloprotease [Bacteroidota bacterium]